MSYNISNEDLRITKTRKALSDAMFTLLKNNSFKKITIKEICEEALISRATFYVHFVDKYDLLKHWMADLWPIDLAADSTFEQLEGEVNSHISENALIFENLFCDADDETLAIFFDFISSSINITAKKNSGDGIYAKNVVLASFYAGGIISYIMWQVKNKFPPGIPPMNRYIYEMIRILQNW